MTNAQKLVQTVNSMYKETTRPLTAFDIYEAADEA